ncbi:MAG: universal stress protein [Cyanobacteria bacterium P01_A01_bin.17]
MFQTILVALDNPELSEQIMQAVTQIKLQPSDQVILTHVMPSSESMLDQPADRPSTDPQGFYRQIEQRLKARQEELSCQTELEIVAGDPAEEIVRLANIHKAQLIVIGTRGLTGVNRILKGSVSSQVVSEAHCSVMVVKPNS